MSEHQLNIAEDFSIHPSGRYYSDGVGNAEHFREEVLLPKIRGLGEKEKLAITIDGTRSLGSSFLTEAFAGVVKYGYMNKDTLLDKIRIVVKENQDYNFFKKRIYQYIKEARFASETYVPTERKY